MCPSKGVSFKKDPGVASTDEGATVGIQTRATPKRKSAFLIRAVFQRKAASAFELDGQTD
jgi:hypothetical protein